MHRKQPVPNVQANSEPVTYVIPRRVFDAGKARRECNDYLTELGSLIILGYLKLNRNASTAHGVKWAGALQTAVYSPKSKIDIQREDQNGHTLSKRRGKPGKPQISDWRRIDPNPAPTLDQTGDSLV
ncbi:MAG: hypothetical protein WCO51_13290, partial [bacterium]